MPLRRCQHSRFPPLIDGRTERGHFPECAVRRSLCARMEGTGCRSKPELINSCSLLLLLHQPTEFGIALPCSLLKNKASGNTACT